MIERARILLVATPTATVRGLVPRLDDPDVDVEVCTTAREALDLLGAGMPDVVIVDGSLPGREVFRLYGRVRAMAQGAAVPIVFTNHTRSEFDHEPTSAPDYYLSPDASLDDVEQLIFTFLPESLVEIDAEPEPIQEAPPPPLLTPRPAPRPVAPPPRPRSRPSEAPPPAGPGPIERLTAGPGAMGLAYLGVYLAGELLAGTIDGRLGLVTHAGLLLALFLHGANLPPGLERTLFWTLWLAPLARIYSLAQPFAGAQPLTWWALTAIPMVVAGVVALRLAGLTPREAGLVPSLRELPVAIVMLPVGLAVGVLAFLLLEPRPIGRELPFGGPALVALIVIISPGMVEEVVFRGVLQRALTPVFGGALALAYGALVYAPAAPLGVFPGSAVPPLVLMALSGTLFGALTRRTGSILSASVAHAGLALGLYVLAPLLVPAGLSGAGPGAVPSTPAGPTAKPAIVVSPSVTPPTPIGPPPVTAGAQPAAVPAAGQPTAKPAAGSLPPLAPSPTPVALAPPIASPPATPAPAGQATTGPAQSGGQIVVVRGTGGTGARLRAQPGTATPVVTVIPENTWLVVIGPDRNVDGTVWRNVRAPNGAEGWIAASFVTTNV